MEDENGFLQTRTNGYVELATSMHRWDQDKWVEASDEIEILAEGAVARKSQYNASFSGNLNDPNGTIDLVTPDGKRLRSHVVGLAYTEVDTGRSVFIAQAKDSQGFVLGRNQVLYLDAFDSGVLADVRYTTTRYGVEADVILRENVRDPREYGLRPEAVRLEVWTEFLDPVQPEVLPVPKQRQNGWQETDVVLDFGVMQIGPGKAFSLANQPAGPSSEPSQAMDVSKDWVVIDQKQFLIEMVPYSEAKPELDLLPEPQARMPLDPRQTRRLLAQGTKRQRPVSLSVLSTAPTRPAHRQMARLDRPPRQPGFVLDWQAATTGNYLTLKGDLTYLVSGDVLIDNEFVLEGGTVVKFEKAIDPVTTRIQLTSGCVFKCLHQFLSPSRIRGQGRRHVLVN